MTWILPLEKEKTRLCVHVWPRIIVELNYIKYEKTLQDFESERKWKLALAKKVAIRASKGMLDQATRGERRMKVGHLAHF